MIEYKLSLVQEVYNNFYKKLFLKFYSIELNGTNY